MKYDREPETRGGEDTREVSPDPDLKPPLVAIGASAGGIESLEPFLHNLPPDSGMAYVVVMHLDPDRKSILPEILQRHTEMEVRILENGTAPEPDTIYILPAGPYAALRQGRLRLEEPTERHGIRHPIDHLFSSMAEEIGSDAFGVILSGAGSDGTAGGKAIKGRGGFVLAEAEESAHFSDMPLSAYRSDIADVVAVASDLPAHLLRLARHPGIDPQTARQELEGELEPLLPRFCETIRQRGGSDFSEYKPATILRRVLRRMAMLRIDRPDAYLSLLQKDGAEVEALRRDLLINVTSFFRDRDAFEALERSFAELLSSRTGDRAIRIWVAGCSTGEEVFSLAMLLTEKMEAMEKQLPFQVFATDIDENVIRQARAGFFPDELVREVGRERKARFFRRTDGRYQVIKSIREKVVFAVHDILRDPPFSRLDLVSCRNLLIYLLSPVQNQLMAAFHKALVPGGLLFLGPSESIGPRSDLFETLDTRWKIYRSRAVERQRLSPRFIERFAAEPSRISDLSHAPQASVEEMGRELLQKKYTPASVLVDANLVLVYTFSSVAPFLEPATGKSSNNVLDMAPPELRPAIRSAVHKALQERRPCSFGNIPVELREEARLVSVSAEPLAHPSAGGRLALLVFRNAPLPAPAEGDGSGQVRRLEDQVRSLSALLKANMEDAGRSDEALRSSNEELMTMNEELQVSNEELETSKEELQSLNEELVTVNAELQEKMDELGRTYNDLNNLMNSSLIPTLFLDKQLRINRFTPAASEIFNLRQSDVGRSIRHLSGNLDYPGLEADVRQVLESLAEVSREIADRNGQTDYLVRILPYRTMEDVIEGAVLTFTDITSRTEMEKDLLLAKEAAEAANRAKDDFLANMSHELRTPMTVFMGMMELLLTTSLSEEQKAYLEKASGAGKSLLRLIEELLDQTVITSGKLKFEETVTDLSSLLKETVEHCRPKAREKGVEIKLEIDALPDHVLVDPHRLRQVLLNLIGNGIKFTEEGEVVLRAQIGEASRGGRALVRFEVEDTGIGIPEEKVDHIFDRFTQVDSSLRRNHGGVGLGLAISRQIVEAMGGEIRVESEPGKGACFFFTLPLTIMGATSAPENERIPSLEKMPEKPSKKPVLIVEDDEMVAELMVRMLRSLGLETLTAPNGRKALDAWEREKPELILMDVQMPVMSGLEAARAIRKQEKGKDGRTVIVGMTAHARQEDRQACIEAGMDDYLAKPFPYNDLVKMIGKYIGDAA